jgi:uncharacterized SAM-binding protein YcdF (DUF218 family)
MISFFAFILRIAFFWVAFIAAGFVIFLTLLPSPVPAHSVHGDAIVVVTGGFGRIATGVVLLQTERAPKLFISGVGKGVRVTDVLREAGVPPDIAVIYGPKISLGHQATNTVENGTEIAAWVKDQGISNIILVSSGYHLPRAQLEVLMAAPGLHITPFATDLDSTHNWWRQRWTIELMIREYLKTVWVAGQYAVQEIQTWWANDVGPKLAT